MTVPSEVPRDNEEREKNASKPRRVHRVILAYLRTMPATLKALAGLIAAVTALILALKS